MIFSWLFVTFTSLLGDFLWLLLEFSATFSSIFLTLTRLLHLFFCDFYKTFSWLFLTFTWLLLDFYVTFIWLFLDFFSTFFHDFFLTFSWLFSEFYFFTQKKSWWIMNDTFILPVMWFSYSKLSSQTKIDLFIYRVSKNNARAKMSCI